MTKHRDILESVKERIFAGDFRPGDRLPSDAQFVKQYDVSRPTVARAIQELEREGLVRRVPGSGTYVQAQTRTDKVLGLLVPGLGATEIFAPICSEIARIAELQGDSLLWGSGNPFNNPGSADPQEMTLKLCQFYISRGASGVFYAPLELTSEKDRVNELVVDALTKAGIAVLLIDSDLVAPPHRSQFDLVSVDNRRASTVLAQHLVQQGCEKILFVSREGSATTVDLRRAGAQDAEQILGIAKVTDARLDPSDAAAVQKLLRAFQPDGIMCANDLTAGRLLHTLDSLGVRVPNDMLVTGFDDAKVAEIVRVPLTTMRQPCTDLGRTAYRTMISRIEEPGHACRDIILSCTLVPRQSTQR